MTFSGVSKKEFKRLKVVKGDLFKLAKKGEFDVIAQGNNCFCTQGAGIAVEFNKQFNTLSFPMELTGKGDEGKLGQIDYKNFTLNENTNKWVEDHKGELTVVNCYTQYNYKYNNGPNVRYNAVLACFKAMNTAFKGKRIGLPAIGAGLAGGSINTISEMMDDCFTDCEVTLVMF